MSDFVDDLLLIDPQNLWFQHDGAPPHKVSSVQQYLRDTFQQQIIGYGGCVEWSPRSLALEFFLWRYIKQRVYATPPSTFQELRNRITDACASASPTMLYSVHREVQFRLQMCSVLLLKDTILSMTDRWASFPASAVLFSVIKKCTFRAFHFYHFCAQDFLL